MRNLIFNSKAMIVAETFFGIFICTCASFGMDLSSCGYLTSAKTTYVLQNNVSSDNGCFILLANDIVLDLNGKTVTYDNSPAVSVTNGGFESALSGSWDVASAANSTRASGSFVAPVTIYGGSYALKTTTPTADQTVTTTNTITLAANSQYTLSAMVYNQVSDSITMSVGIQGASTTATQIGKTWRGFQYIHVRLTTPASPSPLIIELKVTGASGASSGAVYFDDVQIQKNKQHAIAVGADSWGTRFPGIISFGTAKRAHIKNGTINQGADKGQQCNAIQVAEGSSDGLTVENVTFSTYGPLSRALDSINGNAIIFRNNTVHSYVSTIASRDNYDGAIVYVENSGYGNKIHDNTIDKGVQTAIYANQTPSNTNKTEIYNNTITLQTRYTNDFAIVGNGSTIYNNTVNCDSGENSCRGIWAGGTGTKVYSNTISVQELARNQEYNGCPLGGAYGIQTETAVNTEVYGNTVTAYAGDCNSVAYRANPFENGNTSTNNLIHDNVFSAIASGTGRAASLALNGVTNGALSLNNNTFMTNRRWIYVSDAVITDFTMTGNRWETTGTLGLFYPFEVNTWNNSHFTGKFISNTYGTGDKERFESEYFRSTVGWPNRDPSSSFKVEFPPAPPKGLNVVK